MRHGTKGPHREEAVALMVNWGWEALTIRRGYRTS